MHKFISGVFLPPLLSIFSFYFSLPSFFPFFLASDWPLKSTKCFAGAGRERIFRAQRTFLVTANVVLFLLNDI